MGKVWLCLLDLIDFFFNVWAIMVCHAGQLAVIRGPYAFLSKHELNMSRTVLGSGDIHLLLPSLSLELVAQRVTLVMS